jgi:hypothetical protein
VEWCIYRVDNGGSRRRVLRGLGDRRDMMDSCRAGALFGAMVASTAGLARIFASVYTLEIGGGKRRG